MANVITEDRASGAQVVDGSLKFDASKSQYLTRTPGSAGNRRTWTWSGWLKRSSSSASNKHPFYGAYGGSSATSTMLAYDNSTDDVIRFEDDFINGDLAGKTPAVFRDFGGGWYHVVISLDTTKTAVTDGLKIYVNGTQQTGLTGTIWNQNHDSNINSTVAQYLGSDTTAANRFFDGAMSQVYFIDGLVLGPSYFGFTDLLTGTWRPKRLQEGDQAVKNRQLLYNVNTSDNGFDSSSSSRTYDAASRTFATYTTPQSANQGGVGANAAHVYKSPTGSAITWVVSTDTTDRYIWTSEDGVNWTSKGSYYDTDSSPQSVTSTYIALAAGSNGSNVTVTSAIVNFGTNGFYLPFDGNSPIGEDKSGNGNDWTPVNFGGSVALDKATGALPILNTDGGGNVARPGVRPDSTSNSFLKIPGSGGSTSDVGSGSISMSSNNVSSTTNSQFYGSAMRFNSGSLQGPQEDSRFYVGGSTKLTLEGWFNFDDVSFQNPGSFLYNYMFSQYGYSSNNQGWELTVVDSKPQLFTWTSNGTQSNFDSGYTLSDNTWYHIALVFSDNNVKLFVDGDMKVNSSFTTPGTGGSSNNRQRFMIGSTYYDGSRQSETTGRYQDLRGYSTAKYTSNFVVASTDPDILPDTPSGVSGSSKLAKVTDGAVYFDDSGDYLSLASSSDFTLSGEFTIECYAYYGGSGKGMWMTIGEPKNTSAPLGFEWYHTPGASSNSYRVFGDNGYLFNVSNTTTSKVWHHVAISRDSGNNLRIWRDGIQIGSNVSDSNTYQGAVYIGAEFFNGSITDYMDGFISNFRFINGTCLYTSNFTPPTRTLTNVTNTKLLCCQSNTSAIAAAVSPGTITANGDAAATNFNPFTTDINAVRGQETGYCTWNPLHQNFATTSFSNGNLDSSIRFTNGSETPYAVGSITVSSGKWYWEITLTQESSDTEYIGLMNGSKASGAWAFADIAAYFSDARKAIGASPSSYGSTYTTGDVLGIALDADNGNLTFYKNGVSQGVAATGMTFTSYKPFTSANGTSTAQLVSANFGQKPFKFPPPAGFQPLNGANVRPETVITRPDQFVGVKLYTGNDATTHPITGLNFGAVPDFVWIKNRDQSEKHILHDTVRGVGSTLYSNNTDQADTGSTYSARFKSFDFNGFTVGTTHTGTNSDGDDFVAWCWRAGGNKNTFNVDDVGYSSAGDVGFDVGGQNNNAYDRSQTWSSYMSNSSGAGNLFDGVLTNYYGPDGNPQTFIPTSAITVNTSLEVYYSSGSTSRNFEINDNGNVVATGTGTKWVNLNFTGSLTKIYGTNGWNVSAIRIDGKILVDNGVTPPNVPSIAATGASVGTKQGFSIIKYTGNYTDNQTIPHGLTQNVDFVMIKNLDDTRDWIVYHKSFNPPDGTEEKALRLNEKTNTSGNKWPVDLFSPAGIGLGINRQGNNSNDAHIAYCWHDVPGLQKFGSYIGNGDSADGPFVFTEFKTGLVIVKNSSANTGNWRIFDSSRRPTNSNDLPLYPNDTFAEVTSTHPIDFLSNGFKVMGFYEDVNTDGATYIYAAFAEAPTFNLFGGQSNAR